MSPEDFQIVERVFHEALKLEPDQRSAFVAAQIPNDPALRQEVEDLLVAAERASGFLETSLLDGPAEPSARGDSLVGRRIGRYELIRELGRGGMGTVYEAQQTFPPRRVAVKVMHGGAGGDGGYWPGREARILSRLNHPFVASIYDADRTEDGLSYFVMELIAGERLDEYVRKHNLSLRERLKLFCKICEAIQHAHMNFVIHLDLKPSNILVLPPSDPSCQDPQIKVVDFGVAAVTGGDTTRICATPGMGGTLAYMSPEQRRGERERLDVRSDVYSLGVILFQLLTRQLPYPVQGVPYHEAWRILADQPPRRPRSIEPSLPADLETIIRTAMAEEPERRYQGVAELAGDVRRFLADLPITARGPSKLYEWSKFAKRNKGLVATLAAILLGLVTTIVGTYAGLVRARQAEEQARGEAQARKRLTEIFVGDPSGTADSPALRRTPLGVLRSSAQQLLVQGRVEEAEAEFRQLVRVAKAILPPGNWYVAELQGEHGECLLRLRRYAQAEIPLLASYEVLKTVRGQQHAYTIEAVERLIRLYDGWGKPEEAARWRAMFSDLRQEAAGG